MTRPLSRNAAIESLSASCPKCGGEGWRTYVRNGATLVVDELCDECDGIGRIVVFRRGGKSKPKRAEMIVWAAAVTVVTAVIVALLFVR